MAELVFDIMGLNMDQINKLKDQIPFSATPKKKMNFKLKKKLNSSHKQGHKRSLTKILSSKEVLVSSLDLNKSIKEAKLSQRPNSKSNKRLKRRFVKHSGTFNAIPLSHSLDNLISTQRSQSGRQGTSKTARKNVIKIKKFSRNRQ
jgi:hypothetical protein